MKSPPGLLQPQVSEQSIRAENPLPRKARVEPTRKNLKKFHKGRHHARRGARKVSLPWSGCSYFTLWTLNAHGRHPQLCTSHFFPGILGHGGHGIISGPTLPLVRPGFSHVFLICFTCFQASHASPVLSCTTP